MARNAANKAQQEKAGNIEERKRSEEAIDLQTVLSSRNGRRYIWKLLGWAGMGQVEDNPFTGNSQTFFNCGELNFGQRIKAEIKAVDFAAWQLMEREDMEDAVAESASQTNSEENEDG